MRPKPILISAILLFVILAMMGSAMAATLHGKIYDISLNELNDVVVTVDSTPQQRYVSKDGMYTFELSPGTYRVTAVYAGCTPDCESTETVEIADEGDFVYDLFVFPGFDDEDEAILTETYDLGDVDEFVEEEPRIDWEVAIIIAVMIILIIIIYLYYLSKKQQRDNVNPSRSSSSEEQVPEKEYDDELARVVDILKKEGGRTTQKELRKQIPLSEAKISLMVAELESKGVVQKIKKGRGNIIRLK